MAPRKTTSKTRKEKVFHPQSRKAGQVERAQLRKAKVAVAATRKSKRAASLIDKFSFFYYAIPPDCECLSLDELHEIIKGVWLTRHDSALETERSARRKGRPKSLKEQELENLKQHESEEYRTGLELPDLTHPENVLLFRSWDQSSLEFIDLLRFIRINSSDPSSVVVSRPGKHQSLSVTIAETMTVDT